MGEAIVPWSNDDSVHVTSNSIIIKVYDRMFLKNIYIYIYIMIGYSVKVVIFLCVCIVSGHNYRKMDLKRTYIQVKFCKIHFLSFFIFIFCCHLSARQNILEELSNWILGWLYDLLVLNTDYWLVQSATFRVSFRESIDYACLSTHSTINSKCLK